MLDHRFYVGPLGALRALPDVQGDVDTPLGIVGGNHVSLSGAVTRDVLGWKRAWTWNYSLLTIRQAQYVEALQRGMVTGPLYLLDPRRPNRLPEQVASGGSQRRTSEGFIPGNTAVCNWRPFTYINTADTESLPAAPLLAGAIQWQLLAQGAAVLELAGPAVDGRLDVPVLPEEPLEVSGWAVGPSGVSAALTVTVFSAARTALATTTGTPVVLSPSTWAPLTAPLTCPPGAAYLRITPTVGAGTPSGSIYLTALQVASPEPDVVPEIQQFCGAGDDFGGFFLGGGTAQVIPDVGASTYTVPGLASAALTLTERT